MEIKNKPGDMIRIMFIDNHILIGELLSINEEDITIKLNDAKENGNLKNKKYNLEEKEIFKIEKV